MKQRLPKETHFYFSHYPPPNSKIIQVFEPIQKQSGCPPAGWVLICEESFLICTPVHSTSQNTPRRGLGALRSMLGSTRKTLCRLETGTLRTVHTENNPRSHRQDLVTQKAAHRHWVGETISSTEYGTSHKYRSRAQEAEGPRHQKQIWGEGSKRIQAGRSGVGASLPFVDKHRGWQLSESPAKNKLKGVGGWEVTWDKNAAMQEKERHLENSEKGVCLNVI